MKKYWAINFVFVIMINAVVAQPMSSIIRQQALKMSKAMSEMNIKEYAQYTYPTLQEAGKEMINAKASMDSINKFRKMLGLEVKKILIGEVSTIVTYKKIMQATIPQTITLKTMMGVVETQTTLVALSNDGGKKWYFVDANLYKNPNTKAKLPELSPKIILPKMDVKKLDVPKAA